MPEIKAVIDTNIFVRALIGSAANREIYLAFTGNKFSLIISQVMVAELAEVLTRPRLKIPVKDTKTLLHAVRTKAIIPAITAHIKACRDHSDDIILEAAISADADIIVSNDNDLLSLHPFQGIPVVDSRQFLKILRKP